MHAGQIGDSIRAGLSLRLVGGLPTWLTTVHTHISWLPALMPIQVCFVICVCFVLTVCFVVCMILKWVIMLGVKTI
jgi:hypothetical protein